MVFATRAGILKTGLLNENYKTKKNVSRPLVAIEESVVFLLLYLTAMLFLPLLLLLAGGREQQLGADIP